MQFGKVFKKIRLKKGLSQGLMGEKLGHSSPQYISNIERNTCLPSPKQVKKIVKDLRIGLVDRQELIEANIEDYRSKFT